MPSPLATLFSAIDSAKRRVAGQSLEQIGDTLANSIKEWNTRMESKDPKEVEKGVSQLLSVITPAGLGTLVPASTKLKGLAGVHPNYDLDQFLKLEAAGASPKALEKKFGILRDPEGLKTNISDKGIKFTSDAPDKILGAYMQSFPKLVEHPNRATIETALDSPNFFNQLYLTAQDLEGSHGAFIQSGNKALASYDPTAIAASSTTPKQAVEKILDTIQHEMTHAVQKKAGWQAGSSPEASKFSKEFEPTLESILNSSRLPRSLEDMVQEAEYEIYSRHAGEQGANAAVNLRKAAERGGNEFAPISDFFSLPSVKQIFTKD